MLENTPKFNETDHEMMQLALSLGRCAAVAAEVPVGCVISHEGRIVGSGFNLRERLKSPTAHAEVLALQEAASTLQSWRLNECTVYVTLEPCLMCAGALIQARISRLVYAAADPKAGAILSLYSVNDDSRLNHRFVAEAGLYAEQSSALLRDFFRSRR